MTVDWETFKILSAFEIIKLDILTQQLDFNLLNSSQFTLETIVNKIIFST